MSSITEKIQSLGGVAGASYTKPNPERMAHYQTMLQGNDTARDYLRVTRGLTDETVKHFGLGYDSDKHAIAIPMYKRNELINIKYRFIDSKEGPKYINERGAETWLFNDEGLNEGMKKRGLLIVEDTCTSYTKFENFSRFSFINFMKKEVDSLQSRFPGLESLRGRLSPYVYSITFYESVCAMSVDRSKCTMNAREVNNGARQNAQDYRYIDGKSFLALLRKIYSGISIDYLSAESANRHPRLASLLQKRQIRILVRVIVVPIRAIVYFLIKLENALSYRKILRPSRKS